MPKRRSGGAAERRITDLYQAHALGLARLALIILGDAGAAEDVVQDAFLGLYRRWDSLTDPSAAPSYLRTSVLNGCRAAVMVTVRTAYEPYLYGLWASASGTTIIGEWGAGAAGRGRPGSERHLVEAHQQAPGDPSHRHASRSHKIAKDFATSHTL